MRISLKNLLLAAILVALFAQFVVMVIRERSNYIDLPTSNGDRILTEKEVAEQKKGVEHYQKELLLTPLHDREYWEKRLARIRPGMATHVLWKWFPAKSPAYHMFAHDGYQICFYAIDARYGVAFKIDYDIGNEGRVVGIVGVFEHELSLDPYGGIDVVHSTEAKNFLYSAAKGTEKK